MPALDPFQWLCMALLGAEAVQRFIELVVSARRQRARAAQGVAMLAESRTWPLMVLTHSLLFVLPPIEVTFAARHSSVWVATICTALYLAAKLLRMWTLRTLGRAWNTRVIAPERIVTDGPYQFVRHPNYLCVIVELASIPLIAGAWLSCAVLSTLNLLVLAARIPAEEATLMAIPEYRAFFGERARLIPRLC